MWEISGRVDWQRKGNCPCDKRMCIVILFMRGQVGVAVDYHMGSYFQLQQATGSIFHLSMNDLLSSFFTDRISCFALLIICILINDNDGHKWPWQILQDFDFSGLRNHKCRLLVMWPTSVFQFSFDCGLLLIWKYLILTLNFIR